MRAAVRGCENTDIVAGRHAATGTADAVKGRGQIEVRRRGDVDAERVVLGEIAHPAILGMDMLARRDRRSRDAAALAIAPELLDHRGRARRPPRALPNPTPPGDGLPPAPH